VDTIGTFKPVRGPADSVWAVLQDVYTALGLPIHDRNLAEKRLGTCWWRVRRRTAGAPLSRFLDCGEVRSVPNADRMEVELVALTTVGRDEAGSVAVATFVIGIAAESAGSANRFWCTSTGALEARIHSEIQKRLSP
jgi:hypothetical protein